MIGYTVEAPVWKASYRVDLDEDANKTSLEGWALVDNTTDEDWEDIELTLVAGLPISFVHDLIHPRYRQRPVVAVEDDVGLLTARGRRRERVRQRNHG